MTNWLDDCLAGIGTARVAVFGDFCLDAYWLIDADESELSVETSLPVRRVRSQRYGLGGAGNVVANLAALGVGSIQAVTLVGADLFGRQMLGLLAEAGAASAGVLQCQEDWQTLVYTKPCVGEGEMNRIDFGGFNELAPATMDALACKLDAAAAGADIVVLNQQVPAGLSPAPMIERINEVIAARGECMFLVDSRHRAGAYRGAMLKINAHEAARLLGREVPLDERITADRARGLARDLFERTGKTVFVTRGANGIIAAEGGKLDEVPGIQIVERTDTVGAGDTVISALAAALASGRGAAEAARLANIAASVTIRKLQTTGTASPAEIREVGPHPDYVYLPELADDPRQARFADAGPDGQGGEIELVRDLPPARDVRHAIFDHDGTISTLREGWERIMLPTMIQAVLGPRYADADEALYHKVVDHVTRYVDRTTGVQTLVQMRGLVEMVRQFGCVPEEDILDMHGYKALYNGQLLDRVRGRVGKLRRGELSAAHFQLAGARRMLEALHGRGVKLYLASGTDQADLEAEAEALGYAHLFEGGIFGAVGDVKVEAKRDVLERILRGGDLAGPQLVTFGDGPVEIRETHKRGGITVGLASDEVRRFGPSPGKRARLIRAGADVIVPDFTRHEALLALLGLAR